MTTVRTPTVLPSKTGIARAVESARAGGRLGLDTEFLREKTYRPRLCLIQIATADDLFVIDPLDGGDLAPLGGALSDPDIEVVLHAGKQDLDLLYGLLGAVPRTVFDVQMAAGFAGLGGSAAYGVLVHGVLGARLQKGESYSDWCRRPLTDGQLRYAADDVRYLLPVADELVRRLREAGRLEWALEEMRSLELEDTYRNDPADAWRKVTGRGSLSGRAVGTLKEVARWREETAARRDVPRGWIVKDPTLIEIARRAPKSIADLKRIRGLNAREADRSGAAILEAVARGSRAAAEDVAVPPPPREALVRARLAAGLADAVVRSRCEAAGLATEVVTTRAELEGLLAEAFSSRVDEGRHRILQGWRREIVGDAVLALARGDLAIRMTSRPPYLEEVDLGGR